MKKIIFLPLILSLALPLVAQDSIVERNVTIEREFRPIIQDAGKIQTKPQVFVPNIQMQEVHYSDFNKTLTPTHSFNNLGMAEIALVKPQNTKGFARMGGGYWNSLGDFAYDFLNTTDMKLNFMLNHSGVYNTQQLSGTNAQIAFNKLFDNVNFYVGANGNHTYFNQYGQAYDATTDSYDKDVLRTVGSSNMGAFGSKIGIRAIPTAELDYQLQTGYEVFFAPNNIVEHQVRTLGFADWAFHQHTVGLDFSMQNLLYKEDAKNSAAHPDNTLIHIEPFYTWGNEHFNVHAGVNLDFASNSAKVFNPSPEIRAEWIANDALSVYGKIGGEYAQHTLHSAFVENRYIGTRLFFTEEMAYYKPIDTHVGMKFRPQKNLLLNVFANYDYTLDQYYYMYNKVAGHFDITHSHTTHMSAGAEATYHYTDRVKTSAKLTYNYWEAATLSHVCDRPALEGSVSVQARVINRLYLNVDGFFASKRYGLTTEKNVLEWETLKSTYDVNLSASYLFNKNLSVFASLNNLINNKHEVYYAHQVQGFNFLLGASWSF